MSNDARYALLIAVQSYEDDDLKDLAAPIGDARRLQAVLEDPSVGNFRAVTVLNDPTVGSAMRAVEDFFANRAPTDILVFHFGGHAFKDERSEDLYLAMQDTRMRANPEATALTGHYLRAIISRSPARRKLLLLDCCHSGALTLNSRGPDSGDPDARRTAEFRRGVQSIVPQLPPPTVPGTGTIVIGASRATELATESDTGALTGAIVHGLSTGEADVAQRGVISTDDLFEYVQERLRFLTHQHPVRHEMDRSGPFIVAENPRFRGAQLSPKVQAMVNSEDPDQRLAAVVRLRALAVSADLSVARVARVHLEQQRDFDTDWNVRTHAEQCLRTITLELSRSTLDFGAVPAGAAPPAQDVVVKGPPLTAEWSVAGSTSAAVTAHRIRDLLRVQLRADSPGPVQATVTLRSDAGPATVEVRADVRPAVPAAADAGPATDAARHSGGTTTDTAPADPTVPGPRPTPAPAPPPRRWPNGARLRAAILAWASRRGPTVPAQRRTVAGLAVLLLAAGTLAAAQPPGEFWCIPTHELRILTTAQVRDAVAAAAAAFSRESADDGCATIHVSVNATSSDGPARDRLRRKSPDNQVALTAGPQPDVWLPESSAQVELLRRQLGDRNDGLRLPSVEAVRASSTASSPLVLAEPARKPQRDEIAPAQLLTMSLRIPRADPSASSGGLLATRALYAALPAKADARTAEKILTLSTGGDDPRSDLCKLRLQVTAEPLRDVAYLVPEKYVQDYNAGYPLGPACTGGKPAPARRLNAVRLRTQGSPLALDLPCVVVRTPAWGDREQQEMAADFCRFLRDGAGRQVLQAHHLRAPDPSSGGAWSGADTQQVINRWTQAQRPWRVLLAMDVSGSMAFPAPGTATVRMDLARAAARRTLKAGALSERDQLGLWSFATRLSGADDYRQVLPLRSAASGHLQSAQQALAGLEPVKADTGLYDTINAGVKTLRELPSTGTGPQPVNRMIVMTDGENDDPQAIDIAGLAKVLRTGEPVQVSVIATVGADCGPLEGLVNLQCFDEGLDNLDATFAKVFPRAG
jgi:Mg-chelatase subunit ChlD